MIKLNVLLLIALNIVIYSCNFDKEVDNSNEKLSHEKSIVRNDSIPISDSVYVIFKFHKLNLISNNTQKVIKKVDLPPGDSIKCFVNNDFNTWIHLKSNRGVLINNNNLDIQYPIDSVLKYNHHLIDFIYDIKYSNLADSINFNIHYLTNNKKEDSIIWKVNNKW